MHILSSFTTTPQLARESLRACHGGSLLARRLLSVACVLVGLLLLAENLLTPKPDPAGVISACVVIAVGAGLPLAQRRKTARQLAQYAEARETRIALTDAEYRVEGSERTLTRSWDTFDRVRLVRGFWVLRAGSAGALAFPADALDAAQTMTFTAAMRDRGLLVDRRGTRPSPAA